MTRERGRRRLRTFVVVLVVVLLVAGGWAAIRSPFLDVDRVTVSGAQRVPVPDVLTAAGVDQGEPLVLVDLGAVAQRIQRLPWVDDAQVERKLPGELVVRVTERTPALWVRRGPEAVALVDDDGRVLGDEPAPPAGVPELVGVTTVPPAGETLTPTLGGRVLAAMPDALRARVVRVSLAATEVTLGLHAGPEIRLGPPVELGPKGRAALAVLSTLAPPFPLYVDVLAPTAPVTG